MKIIDLLNKIANDKAPKKIRFKGKEYEFDGTHKDYVDINHLCLFEDCYMIGKILNDEVEIIEDKPILVFDEEDKVVEVNIRPNLIYKLSADGLTITSVEETKEIEEDKEIEELIYSSWSSCSEDLQEVYNKVNELIKVVNELKKGK